MTQTARLSDSQEDYLEAIFHIVSRKQAARPKDIADRLKVNQSSVTGALRVLADRGMIHYAPYDLVTLTERGRALGAEVVRRHEILRDFFVRVLRIEEDEADEAACRMEHAMTRSLLERLVDLAEFFEACPIAHASWTKGESEGFHPDERCEACLDACAEQVGEGGRHAGRT